MELGGWAKGTGGEESPLPLPTRGWCLLSAHFNQEASGELRRLWLTAFMVITSPRAVFPDKNSEHLRRVVGGYVSALHNPFLSEAQSTNPPYLLPGKFHLKSKHLLGGKSKLWDPAPTLPCWLPATPAMTEAPEDPWSIAHNNLMALAQDLGGDGVLA